MNEITVKVFNIVLGSFFFGLMVFAFYKALFSKSNKPEQQSSAKNEAKSTKGKPAKTKFVGRA